MILRPTANSNQSGFSFSEMLIATAIMGICMAMGTGAIVASAKIFAKTRQIDLAHDRLRRCDDLIQRNLINSPGYPSVYSNGVAVAEGQAGNELRVMQKAARARLRNSPNANTMMIQVDEVIYEANHSGSYQMSLPSDGRVTNISQISYSSPRVKYEFKVGDAVQINSQPVFRSHIKSMNSPSASQITMILEDKLPNAIPANTTVIFGRESRYVIENNELRLYADASNTNQLKVITSNLGESPAFKIEGGNMEMNLSYTTSVTTLNPQTIRLKSSHRFK